MARQRRYDVAWPAGAPATWSDQWNDQYPVLVIEADRDRVLVAQAVGDNAATYRWVSPERLRERGR